MNFVAPAIAQGAKGIAAINQQENARNIRVLDEIHLSPFNNGNLIPYV